jgi:hypothetical protein
MGLLVNFQLTAFQIIQYGYHGSNCIRRTPTQTAQNQLPTDFVLHFKIHESKGKNYKENSSHTLEKQ